MSKRYPSLKPIPRLWLLSDARNDAVLEKVLKRFPKGSGFVFRHYHLNEAERFARYRKLRALCRMRGVCVVLSGTDNEARRWGADAAYGAKASVATVHSLRELRQASGAKAVLLSPVHATRSHPGGKSLGSVRFLMLARAARVPVIALGGMSAKRARALPMGRLVHGWAAIDGLSGR